MKAPSSRHSDVVDPSEWSSVECVIGCRSCVSNAGRHRRPDEVAIISQSIYGLAFGQVRIVAAYPWRGLFPEQQRLGGAVGDGDLRRLQMLGRQFVDQHMGLAIVAHLDEVAGRQLAQADALATIPIHDEAHHRIFRMIRTARSV